MNIKKFIKQPETDLFYLKKEKTEKTEHCRIIKYLYLSTVCHYSKMFN